MPVLGTLPDDKAKLVGLYVAENSKYQTNLSRLNLFKTRAQNPNEPADVRAEARDQYNKLKKTVDAGRKKLEQIQDSVDKLEGGKELTKVQDEYKDLVEQKSLLIDPNDPLAAEIDAKIEKLVKPFQNAYSKVVGTRVSETVARTNLLGKKVPGFGTPQDGGQTPTITPQAETVTPPPAKSASGKKVSTGKKTVEAAQLPNEPAYTVNPVTGERIKVSDIKPATGEKTTPVTVGPNVISPAAKENAAATIAEQFGLSETLFKNIDSLKNIFEEYTRPGSGMTDDELRRRIRNDVWYKKNSKEIKTRFVQYYNYRDLQESGQADGSTDYEQQIASIERQLEKRAAEIGSAAANDPVAIRKAAENIYLTNKEDDKTFIDDFLAASIKPVAGMIGGKVTEGYSGTALTNYNTLVKAARDNGFQVSDILPGGATEAQVLQGIASGKIDVNRVVADARKLAAQGQPQYVRDLLAQGYNLSQVFQPYRQTMATILDIGDPDQIDLNDPLLRSAITDKGDMNLYDFKKALRQDNRWQYTTQAKEDVSTAALKVLRDFGFQG